jgi:hypothetical protein
VAAAALVRVSYPSPAALATSAIVGLDSALGHLLGSVGRYRPCSHKSLGSAVDRKLSLVVKAEQRYTL